MAKIQKFMQINCNSLSLQPIIVKSMKVFTTNRSLHCCLASIKTPASSLGFVPTMGALHQGHLSLIKRAIKENETVVVSIFVNPTQFNNAGDLETYPQDLKLDLKRIESIGSLAEIIVYAPSEAALYRMCINPKVSLPKTPQFHFWQLPSVHGVMKTYLEWTILNS